MFDEITTAEINNLIKTANSIWGGNCSAEPMTEFSSKRPWFKWEWLLYGKVRVCLLMDLGFLSIAVFYNGEFHELGEAANDEREKECSGAMDKPEEIRYRLLLLDRVAKDLLWEM
jgi:hypothetical protein